MYLDLDLVKLTALLAKADNNCYNMPMDQTIGI